MPPFFPLTLALYAAACTLYFVAVAQPQLTWPPRLATPLIGCGLLSQVVDIAWLCMRGQHPASSAREALFFASFLMLAALPLRTFRQPLPLLGALLVPVAMVIEVLVRVLPMRHGASPSGATAASISPKLATLHIFSATLGIALFGVAAAASVVYLLSERRLKQRPSRLFGGGWRGPSLELLDAWNQQAIVFGLLSFTAALVSGTYWMLQVPLPGAGPEPSLLQQAEHLLRQPRYTLAVVTWLLYAGLLVARVTLGLRGRRAARVTLLGFVTGLAVLLVYLVRDLRGLQP